MHRAQRGKLAESQPPVGQLISELAYLPSGLRRGGEIHQKIIVITRSRVVGIKLIHSDSDVVGPTQLGAKLGEVERVDPLNSSPAQPFQGANTSRRRNACQDISRKPPR
jgi:hypothetical protein